MNRSGLFVSDETALEAAEQAGVCHLPAGDSNALFASNVIGVPSGISCCKHVGDGFVVRFASVERRDGCPTRGTGQMVSVESNAHGEVLMVGVCIWRSDIATPVPINCVVS